MQTILKFSFCIGLAAALSGVGRLALADEIFLQNGDRITGEVVEATDSTVTMRTEAMGIVTLDRAHIQEAPSEPDEHGIPEPPPAPADAAAAPEAAPAPSTVPAAPAAPAASAVATEFMPIKIAKPWTGSISGGINAREGNTSSQSASSRFNVSRKKGPDELQLTGDSYFAASRKKMTAMKMFAGVRYDHFFQPDNRGWYGLGRFEADQDRFADINQRLVPAVGPGYAFFNSEDFKLKVENAVGFAQTNFRDTTVNRFEGVLIPRLYFESRIYGRSRFIQDTNAYFSLDASDGYRVRSESTIEAPFLERLKIRLSLIDDFNSHPSVGAENNDIRLISSVAYYL